MNTFLQIFSWALSSIIGSRVFNCLKTPFNQMKSLTFSKTFPLYISSNFPLHHMKDINSPNVKFFSIHQVFRKYCWGPESRDQESSTISEAPMWVFLQTSSVRFSYCYLSLGTGEIILLLYRPGCGFPESLKSPTCIRESAWHIIRFQPVMEKNAQRGLLQWAL